MRAFEAAEFGTNVLIQPPMMQQSYRVDLKLTQKYSRKFDLQDLAVESGIVVQQSETDFTNAPPTFQARGRAQPSEISSSVTNSLKQLSS